MNFILKLKNKNHSKLLINSNLPKVTQEMENLNISMCIMEMDPKLNSFLQGQF